MTSQCFIACSHRVVMTNECFIAGSHCVVMTNECFIAGSRCVVMPIECFIACSRCVVTTNQCFIAGSHCVVMTNEVQMRENVTDYVMHARECQNAQQNILCVMEQDACVNGGLFCFAFSVMLHCSFLH